MSETAQWRAHETWPSDVTHVHDAREFVRRHLATRGISALSDDVVLVVSELAANAAVHGRSGFAVTVEGGRTFIAVRVWDQSSEQPVPRDPAPSDPHGRGLRVVRMLSEQWGVDRPAEGGKAVWARFRLPDDHHDLLAGAGMAEPPEPTVPGALPAV